MIGYKFSGRVAILATTFLARGTPDVYITVSNPSNKGHSCVTKVRTMCIHSFLSIIVNNKSVSCSTSNTEISKQ